MLCMNLAFPQPCRSHSLAVAQPKIVTRRSGVKGLIALRGFSLFRGWFRFGPPLVT